MLGTRAGLIVLSTLLLAQWSAAAADHAQLRPPTPVGDPAKWIAGDEYPPIALRNNEQGTTGFALTIDSKGDVVDCVVTSTSGSVALDIATCDRVRAHATFTPAVDAAGRPIMGRYASQVRWVIPSAGTPNLEMEQVARLALQANEIMVSFRLNPTGDLTDCRIETAAGPLGALLSAGVNGMTPAKICAQAAVPALTDVNGKPIVGRFRVTLKIEPIGP